MKTYKKFLSILDKSMLVAATTVFIALFGVSVAQIILRGFFKVSLLWAQDFCVLLTCWVMMLGCAVLFHRADHLAVTFLVDKLPPKLKLALSIITRILLLAFCLVLGYHGLTVVKVKMGLYYTSLRWPTGFAYLSLPVFGVTSVLFLIEKIIDSVTELFGHKNIDNTKE